MGCEISFYLCTQYGYRTILDYQVSLKAEFGKCIFTLNYSAAITKYPAPKNLHMHSEERA